MAPRCIGLAFSALRNSRRSVPWLPTLIIVIAAALATGCAAKSTGAAMTSASSTPTTVAAVTEALPPLTAESDPADTSSGGDGAGAGRIVDVNAPTLGSHFSGVGDWGPNDVPLTSLEVAADGASGSEQPPGYFFALYSVDGIGDLTYVRGAVTPDGTYFQLSDSCAGESVATSAGATDGRPECGLVFDPHSPATAADPFDAEMVLHFQLTCTGQDNPTCRRSGSARSADAEHPVVLDFTQTVTLHGSVSAGKSPSVPSSTPVSDEESTDPAEQSTESTE